MGTDTARSRMWRNGNLEAENFSLDKAGEFLTDPDCVVWVDLVRPGAGELDEIAEQFSLDAHAVEDALSRNERPKAVRYPRHVFLTVNPIHYDVDEVELRVGRVSAFGTDQALITVRLDDVLDMDAVVQRWDDNSGLIKYGPHALFHGLLDEVVDRYYDTLEDIDEAVESVEDLLFDDQRQSEHEVSRRTFRLRRALVDARHAVLPMREVVGTITRRAIAAEHSEELGPYWDDLNDHVLRVVEWTDSLRDAITSIFDTNMSLADTRMNVIMKKLTSWAAIIAVPTAITGYFGQNVPYPGFGKGWGFWLSLVSMVLVAIALYGTFRRKDWL
ncbi:MAG TPA: magnesium transporter CorA family protein [Jatrophihabitans sp.]|nr:magnesium transporter CorA family protein [Jatrophihabitans sp.]